MKEFIISFTIIVLLGLLFSSCSKESAKPTLSLTTSSITTFDEVSAMAGGNITNDGGAAIAARGLCFSTVENPTVSNDTTITGAGTGSFNDLIGPLKPNTTYHVRAYATNANGTSYGPDVTVTTKSTTSLVSTGLLAFYKFDGNTFDYTGNGNDLENQPTFNNVVATPITYTSNKNGSANTAANFNGTSNALNVYTKPSSGSSAGSISFWFYPMNNTADGVGLVGVMDAAGTNAAMGMTEEAYPSGAAYADHFTSGVGTNFTTLQTGSLVSRNSWHHMVGTLSQSGSMTWYVDNSVVTTGSFNGFPQVTSWWLTIGGYIGQSHLYKGYLDNVRIYNRELSSAEVTQLYNE